MAPVLGGVALGLLTFVPAGAATTGTTSGAGSTAPSTPGYWVTDSSGHVSAGGAVPYAGEPAPRTWSAPVVGVAPTPDAKGYWLASSDGQVQAVGDAAVYGPPPPQGLNKPVVGMAATPDGGGYWLVASDGGIFTFGDAHFFGSTGAMRLNRPIMAMAATPDGRGYWLVASDGGIFTFGDAQFYGSTGSTSLSAPVVGAAVTPDGAGYWLATAAGRVYAFGDAAGKTGGTASPADTSDASPVVGMASTSDGGGYWLAHADGTVTGFGDATLGGGGPAPTTGSPVVAVAAPGPPPAAARAVQFGMAQVGKPYQYGGSGPDSYDCSGLVMASYAVSGIHLPRVAQDQYDAGPVLASGAALEPGDIVFFGTPSDITHDGIYIGNGQMVDAPHSGANVRVESYQWSDYVGATRPAARASGVTS